MLAIAATLARSLLGLELEPQFNEPYRSTSLQDFWGRRWNLMITTILRPTVYDPTRRIFSPLIGKNWASICGIVATFVVSGLMHELIFFYMGQPTGEVVWFFVLHGVFLAVEIIIKKSLHGRFRLHPVVSTPLTVGFVMMTSFWLFFPAMLRDGFEAKAFREFAVVINFVMGLSQTMI
ncbi:acyl-CoA--sterol O-acyltransferase 1-like [Thalictrum thalictroides]|uniref:Acyl-CoA--sterol O-acyltransferase 1-like n=1 Tax=Thalictrum thalictroides TaxID=46969 RepID=A0A7J6W4W4_THATH|nr:acyl-CoA--sterol O-acyltransferase 1-like [Thalictrum thalictroides]